MKAVRFALALLALPGCAAVAPTPIQYVDRPVAVNCIPAAPTRPLYETERLPASASDLQFADALANDWVLSRGYEANLELAVRACLQQTP